ncbi:hypothetical protein N7462_003699 [Penicillium macrosclerotiorum]|uniref:uncharacterized protein n=1 Tax=Penicillium macrosclerotiorum TaxID=303699 RepID=UPI002547BFAB|nr:uncharacterized protein N7462_003699 [Penicillium macrosclerotiorum]KAJ5689307.1 hypothetical protein N7462_003699 [Penicillium macrosclerotiorum]
MENRRLTSVLHRLDISLLTTPFALQLRCTGRIGGCDRCRAKLIACVFPSTETLSHAAHNHNGSISSTTSRTSQRRGPPAIRATGSVPEPPALSKSPSPPQAVDPHAPSQMRTPASQREALFDSMLPSPLTDRASANPPAVDWDSEMSHLLMDIEELSGSTTQLKTANLANGLNSRTADSYDSSNPDDQQYGAGPTRLDLHRWTYSEGPASSAAVNHSANESKNTQLVLDTTQKSPTLPPGSRPRPNVSGAFALDPLMARNEPAAEPVIRDLWMEDFPNSNPRAPPADPVVDPATDSTGPGAKSDGCSCMHNAVRVVQQLDDDDFHITTLSLGQVLQLQKWIISQCYKPLDCVTCKFLPTVHTVLVIICDRLTEMFECIHKRIKKANQRISGLTDFSDQSTSASSDSLSSTERSGELYCTSSHVAAGKANCNPELFSADFPAMYSTEEQVHMIRVLLKLQVRNFRALLMRVGNASQITGSEARQAKIKSMIIRLGRAASDIDNSLQAVLQLFAVSHP